MWGQRRALRILGVFLFTLVSLSLLAATWDPPSSNPNAVWITENSNAVKVSNGTVSFRLPGTDAVRASAADPARGRFWTFDQTTLKGFESNGELRVAQPVSMPDSAPDAWLKVEKGSGAVWLVQGRRVSRFDELGNLTTTVEVGSSDIVAVAFDQQRDELWVGTNEAMHSISVAGGITFRFSLDDPPTAIAIAPSRDEIWVAQATVLSRYDRAGQLMYQRSQPGILHVASGTENTVWFADAQRVWRMDSAGHLFFEG